MIQIISYEVKKNILTAGFKVDNFVVFSSIAYDNTKTKSKLLQLAYQQIKKTIDYEKTLDEHSIISDFEGEEFIPEEPRLKTLKLLVGKDYVQFEEEQEFDTVYLSTITKDQYNEDIDIEVNISSTLGEVEDDILAIPNVSEVTEVVVTATVGEISDSKTIYVYPYIEPVEPEPDIIEMLSNRVTDAEQTIDIMLGGEVIE